MNQWFQCQCTLSKLFQIGSCYLFDCGTTANFRCVFDPIENYMTGVLMPKPEEPPELEDTVVQKKEEDLPRLKAKESLSELYQSRLFYDGKNVLGFTLSWCKVGTIVCLG